MGLDLTPKLVTLEEKDMKTETLGAGQQFTVDLQAPTAGTVLNWNFKTDDYDVGFCVYFGSVSPENEIVSCPGCDSHINVQKGSLPCDKPGKCEIIFFCSQTDWRNPSDISSYFIVLSTVIVFVADVLCFDNSYSKFRSKTLYYVTQIVPPAKNNGSG